MRGARVMGGCKREGWRGGGMRVRGVRVMGTCKMEGWRGVRDEGSAWLC